MAAPVDFEVGADPDMSFASLVEHAEALLTTSIAEGFGLAYLEAYAMGKDCVGRNLPAITKDFSNQGLKLEHLYNEIPVRHPSGRGIQDFGMLAEQDQRKVILDVHSGLLPEVLSDPLRLLQTDNARIERNQSVVAHYYNSRNYGRRLHGIYQELLEAEPAIPTALDPTLVLDLFAELKRSPLLS
ncbi:MAG: hypothetical protein LR015_00840 [Verrucomicrobia bacterium]|nr:hypothetical protein [Verrucomicrobiota bacterium]